MSTDTLVQNIYEISVNIKYFDGVRDTLMALAKNQIAKYEINKDATTFNWNQHILTVVNISASDKVIMENDDTLIQVIVSENSQVISDKLFHIDKLVVVKKIDAVYVLSLGITSVVVRKLITESNFGNVSTFDTENTPFIRSFDLLSKLLGKISSKYGKDLDTHYNNSGIVSTIYPEIRFPEFLPDVELFDYLFENYPSYLLEPYFIIDDFHIIKGAYAPYNIIVSNICNLGNYNLQNARTIKNLQLESTYLGSTPITNYQKITDKLAATLIIRNTNENSIREIKPASESKRSGKIMTVESSMDIASIKSKLYLLKRLRDYKASYEVYNYNKIGIRDITFLNTYNISSNVYDHLVVGIEYTFSQSPNRYAESGAFDLNTIIKFAKVPPNLLAGK